VPDALACGADTLVSIGGVQSNHTRQVAAVAARLGLKALLVQESWVNWPDSVNDRVGNILLSRIMGADVRLADQASASASSPAGSRRLRTSAPPGTRRTPSRPEPQCPFPAVVGTAFRLMDAPLACVGAYQLAIHQTERSP
jgi:hypothetical protein